MSEEDKIRNMNNMNYDNIPKERLISIHKDTLESHRKLRERIDKAIEYIENNVLTYIDEDGLESITDKEENELIKILRGDKE